MGSVYVYLSTTIWQLMERKSIRTSSKYKKGMTEEFVMFERWSCKNDILKNSNAYFATLQISIT
jgi:hypothetical protein